MKFIPDIWRYAYAASDPKQNVPAGAKVHRWKVHKGSGLVAIEENRVIFSFAGTQDNLRDWLRNLSALPSGDGLIHKGFYNEWKMFKDKCDRVLEEQGPDVEYIFTGHSQGGAIATIGARHFAKNRKIPCSCVAFAAPPQGRRAYRNQLNKLPIDLTNVWYSSDIVPRLRSLRLIGYKHAGKIRKLRGKVWHWIVRPMIIWCHLPKTYNKAIKRKWRD